MNFRDVELLSAYLDGRLAPSDAARLESRLSADPALRTTLEDLRQTRGLLRKLPQRRAPRDFRLTPRMAGIRAPEPRSVPIFRFATALAALLFVAAVALNALTPFAASHLSAAAPAPAYGMGGGGGGSGGAGPVESNPQFTEVPPQAALPAATAAPAATEEPTLQAFTTLAGTPTPEALAMAQATQEAQDAARTLSTAPTNKAAPLASAAAAQEAQTPIPAPWVLALGILMIACALAAWFLRRSNERRIRSQWNQK